MGRAPSRSRARAGVQEHRAPGPLNVAPLDRAAHRPLDRGAHRALDERWVSAAASGWLGAHPALVGLLTRVLTGIRSGLLSRPSRPNPSYVRNPARRRGLIRGLTCGELGQ